MNKMVILVFQILILNKVIECRVSRFGTFNQIMNSIQKALINEGIELYDLSNAKIIDLETKQCLDRNMSVEHYRFGNGKFLIVL